VFSCEPDSRQPIRPNTVAKRFTKKAKALGHGYTLYGLRHFMATQLGAVASARRCAGCEDSNSTARSVA